MKRIHHLRPGALAACAAMIVSTGLFLTACEKANQPFESVELDPADFPATPDDKPIVKLLRAGSGETRALRLAPKVGLEQTLRFEMKGKINGDKMDMSMDLASEVTRVGTDGTFDVKATISDLDMQAAGAPDDTGEMVKDMLKDLAMTWTFNERGDLEAQKITGGLGAMMDQSFGQLFLSLPRDKIGVGATWVVNDVVSNNGMKLRQQMRYRVKRFRGTTVELDMRVTQKAAGQVMGAVTLESLESSGKGSLIIDTTKALPQLMKLDLRMKAKVSAGGKSQSQETSFRFEWTTK